MQIFHAIKSGFKSGLDFAGHSTRPEFWGFVLFMIAGGVAAHYFDAFILGYSPSSFGPVLLAFLTLTIIPYLAVGARRLHAMGMSGWWQMIPINLFLLSKLLFGYVDFNKPFVEPRDWIFPGLLMSLILIAVIIQLLLITWYSQASQKDAASTLQMPPLNPVADMQAV
jgi:uncharacterized membrane protein YhaH (DUF805 family)